MKTSTKILSLLLAAFMILSLAACGQGEAGESTSTDQTQKTNVSVAALKGPTGMGMVKLMKNADQAITANNYSFSIESDPSLIGPKLIKGEVDIAACPLNMAAALYNKTKATDDTKDDLKLLAINTLGVLYILENGNSIKSFEDLRGKTVYATGLAATPQYAFNYILTENGLDPAKDLTIEYKAEHSELATLAAKGDAKILLLPEPFVTTVLNKNENIKQALDLTEEWERITQADGESTSFAMGALVVRADFAKENPQALEAFLSEYKESVDYVNQNQSEAAALIVNYDIVADLKLAQDAIDGSKLTFIIGSEMKETALANYEVLFNADKASVGGALPDDDFFYNS
ncbi:MAG: ABC transporter substrate-binding protein [Clostridiales bacterium]|mgnify:CR=1 FL=1|nr:ABC transporter substrate-binding protein [Clostridiales bacterium]